MWRAITLATLVLVPAVWSLLAGLVAVAADDPPEGFEAGAAIAFGLCVIPFAFIVLAFASEHPRAPGAVVRAMGLCLLIGIPVSALANDAVTGIVAGVGAGGIAALRSDIGRETKIRALAVAVAAAYTFVLARVAGAAVVVATPVFPFTCLGLADHYSEWRQAKARSSGEASPVDG
jgi:hypothetical protein